ncbi:MarR family winged helix-turn-helix transcriptional regulator [Micromonospora sp. NPDC000668]|uniref:MarR family winged helix-turn-helix transcriptional regulator n=1 Tax=Micromonospora sp. NPDC000668 TaxID=3364219 RepID=UPI00369D6342
MALVTRSLAGLEPEVTVSQYRVPDLLESRGPQRMAEVAASLNVRPSSASRQCSRLERRHVVSRRSGATDRREVYLHLTAAGGRLLAEITDRQRAALADPASALSSVSVDVLIAALHSLSAAADLSSNTALSSGDSCLASHMSELGPNACLTGAGFPSRN